MIDNKSEPGAWARELAQRPQYTIQRCGMRDVCERRDAELRKYLRDANRGAELNSKVNALLIDEQDALRAENERLRELMGELVDDDDCWFDHHGYCQAHGWFYTEPACPHARGKALAKGEPSGNG